MNFFTHKSSYSLLLGICCAMLFVGIVSAAVYRLSGTTGIAYVAGVWHTDKSGNAGTVTFDQVGGTAQLDGYTLTGKFFIETVGWAVFYTGSQIIPPVSGKILDYWTVSGAVMSKNAGYISLTGVLYNPISGQLVGTGWNYGVGKISFTDRTVADVIADPTAPVVATSSETTPTGFVGRVKILGNIGGKSSYDVLYDLGSKFNLSKKAAFINNIRKNIALLSRNMGDIYANNFSSIHPNLLGNKIFYINNTATDASLRMSSISSVFPTNSVDSLILKGGNLIIDADISGSWEAPKGIIVLKNDQGIGGNIVIAKDVKKIEGSLVAEGSIYSGDDMSSLYADTLQEVTNLPPNQLYIHGIVSSNNTIGGAIKTGGSVCAYEEVGCTYESAIKYDFNFFRLYVPDESGTHRAYLNDSLDAYSMIIDYDFRLVKQSPPGF